MASKQSKNRKERKILRFIKVKWLIYLMLLGIVLAVIGYFVFDAKTKPFRERAETYDLDKIDDVEVVSKILDRKGRILGRIFVENRDVISIKQVPQPMIDALVAGEDQRFFNHDGVDRIGVARAFYLNWRAGRQTQGASTITQQLARNAFHLKEEADKRGEGGLARKAVEAYLAMRIEERYSKNEILELYLNRVPFGSGFYGIRSASLGYFGKEPRDLTVSECASLVGCIKNPTKISPLNDLEMNKKARNQVLKRMMAEGYLSKKEGKKLQEEDVVVNPKPIQRGTSHLYDRIAEEIRERLGEDLLTEGGFNIHTTIDIDVQKALQESLLKQLAITESNEGYSQPRYEDYRASDETPNYLQGAGLVIDNETGGVIAYVGGRDFTHNQYDFLESGRKPVGTAFLPFVYTAALEKNMPIVSMLIDRPMDNRAVMVDGREGILGEWGMETLKPEYEGDVTMRRAMEVSKIAASVRLGKKIGLGTVMKVAKKFGLSFPETKLLARMLVGTDDFSMPELVKAYASFANLGTPPGKMHFITRIDDLEGNPRYNLTNSVESKPVVSEQVAFLMHTMLQSSLKNGTGADGIKDLVSDPSLAGKTGTTYDFSDNWFIGYNGNFTCGVWMGFLHGRRIPIYPGAFSRDTVLPTWIATMNEIDKSFPDKREIAVPDELVSMEICKSSGRRKTRYCQEYKRNHVTGVESYNSTSYTEYFLKGAGPKGYCDVHGVGNEVTDTNHNFGSAENKAADTYSIPIQPKAPLLLGNDPYGSEQPDFAPRDPNARRDDGADLTFDALDKEDRNASIKLDRPARIEIHEE